MKHTENTLLTRPSLSAVYILFASVLCHAGSTNAAIIINELDYDQPGTDNAEFIELYNNGNNTVSMDGYTIELINGSNSSVYRRIDLSGFNIQSNDYFVICNASGNVANCDYSFTTSNSWIQNGAPDALALYNKSQLIMDSLSYEGTVSPFTEGNNVIEKDSNGIITSLSRFPDGFDTDNNRVDFTLGCITPGSTNITGNGDCSITSVSTVPVPASVWLFCSGLLGLVGIRAPRNTSILSLRDLK